jgi:hypothetical protein
MLVTKKQTVTEERVVTEDILCNVCGGSLLQGDCGPEGVVEHEMTCGYDSRLFGDMTRLKFSICESCLFEWSRNWKYSPIHPTDEWWRFWNAGCVCRHPSEGSECPALVEEDCPVHGNSAPGVTRLHCDPTPNYCLNQDYRCTCPGNLLDSVYYRTAINPRCNQHGERRPSDARSKEGTETDDENRSPVRDDSP